MLTIIALFIIIVALVIGLAILAVGATISLPLILDVVVIMGILLWLVRKFFGMD